MPPLYARKRYPMTHYETCKPYVTKAADRLHEYMRQRIDKDIPAAQLRRNVKDFDAAIAELRRRRVNIQTVQAGRGNISYRLVSED